MTTRQRTVLLGWELGSGLSHARALLRLARAHPDAEVWMTGAALSTIAFNLIAVMTGVREVEAIWGNSAATADSGLQQALAISAFLMLYGAALLAAGFWKRNSFRTELFMRGSPVQRATTGTAGMRQAQNCSHRRELLWTQKAISISRIN